MKISRMFYSGLRAIFALCIGLFLSFSFLSFASAHALFPPEVVEFIEQNPNVTDKELDIFFTEKYGYSLEEYFNNLDKEKTAIYDENFDVFSPSQEYLNLEKNNTNNIEGVDKLNELTNRALENDALFQNLSYQEKNLFLKNVLQLKYQKSGDSADKSLWETVKTYVIIGVEHILSGTDHILFVISLLLFPILFRKILILISVFTISHTITIILAGLHIVTLSSKIVEPIIAFSIIITTVMAMYLNYTREKSSSNKSNKSNKCNENSEISEESNTSSFFVHAVIIFIFGLFHGLGFAGAFAELNIDTENYLVPLISMNVGVELGQLFIIMIAFPIIWIVRNQKYGQLLLHIVSALTIGLALFWFIQRIL